MLKYYSLIAAAGQVWGARMELDPAARVRSPWLLEAKPGDSRRKAETTCLDVLIFVLVLVFERFELS